MEREEIAAPRIVRRKAGQRKSPEIPGYVTTDFFDQLTWSSLGVHLEFTWSSLGELGDLMRKPRNLAARIVLVNDAALRCLHQRRFRDCHRLQRRFPVAALD